MKLFAIIFGIILTLSTSPRLSPARATPPENSNRAAESAIPSSCPFTGSRTALHSTPPLIAGIDPSEGSTYRTSAFTLETHRILKLCALGDGGPATTLDFGGIEDAETGRLVWVMDYLSTEDGGGNQKTGKVDRLLPLRAGTYRLHFTSNPSRPPHTAVQAAADSHRRGIWLFDETEDHKERSDGFWEKATVPEQFGWSSVKLDALRDERETFGTDALMLVTDGKVIFEYGHTTNRMRSHSTRKSLLSALYGIYVAEGDIDLNATLEQLNITESVPLTAREKQATALDLLNARSGVYIPAAAEAPSMRKARSQRGSHPPGSFWYYNNWDFNVLGTIFRRQTGQDLYRAFKERIADPIGMQDFILHRQTYRYETDCSLHPAYPFLISARDMAKFGQLFLQQGTWNDSQIVPEQWVAASTASYSRTNRPGIGYGYLWWVVTDDGFGLHKGSYFAAGVGGQRVYVIPQIHSVVVHRINVNVPGTDAAIAEIAPDAVINRMMAAYTGNGGTPGKSAVSEKKEPVAETRLLDMVGRSSNDYGKSFRGFRLGFWIGAVVLTSGLAIWTTIYLLRRVACRLRGQAGDTAKDSRLADWIKWIAASGGLLCSVYICIILRIPYAFEYVAMVGMPADMDRHQQILIHPPSSVFY